MYIDGSDWFCFRFSVKVVLMEKRFNFVGGYLYDGNKPIGHVEDIKFRQDFEDIVNALHEENQRLQKKLDCITKSLQNELNQYGGFR